ncbi:MAG: hypothetical protein DRI34_13415 [Deltaproteobacteria bacterium]|nr:MAG: hypothetical protein DRI34_13415 [Deltaproteobacteria bacterium]
MTAAPVRQAEPQPIAAMPFIMAVGGGKGGTGKSVVAINVARALAGEGLKVVLADLDLGGANLHLLSGLRHCQYTLRDFIGGAVSDLSSLLVAVPELGVDLLPGSDEVAGMVQPGYQRKLKLIRHLHHLPAEVVVCDLGGNSGLDNLDIFNEADWGLVVTTLEPTAVQNAYGFMKAAILRRLVRLGRQLGLSREQVAGWWSPAGESCSGPAELINQLQAQSPELAESLRQSLRCVRQAVVVNMAEAEEARRIFRSLEVVSKRFLDLELDFVGWIPTDDTVHEAVLHGRVPGLQRLPLLTRVYDKVQTALEPGFAVGCNEEVLLNGRVLHVQTEDLGASAAAYHTLVYSGGHIVLSKRVEYSSSFFQRAPSRLKQDRVRYLHRTIIAALQTGRLQVKYPPLAPPGGTIPTNEVNHGIGRSDNR